MIKINKILTCRNITKYNFADIVFEWEDVFAESLRATLCKDNTLRNRKIVRYLKIDNLLTPNSNTFAFTMTPSLCGGLNKKNVIQIIIDYFLSEEEYKEFVKNYSKNKVVIVSSKEAYDYLLSIKCPLNLKHIALSISDKYKITPETTFQKEYDLVLFGRQNKVLMEYLDNYRKEHPDFNYVFCKQEEGIFNYYEATGKCLGDMGPRDKYLQLMRKARISFYSTPGIDGGEIRTKGFSQVTPRLLELMSCGCHLIARYRNNSDTDYYELNSICPSIDTYEDFEKRMDYCLNNPVDMKFYSDYLSKHYTSVRAKQLTEILKDL